MATRARRWRETGLAALMLGPSLAVLGVFVLYPLARAFWIGHQRCDALGKHCNDQRYHSMRVGASVSALVK